ncbi:hypothetical protein [Crocosphaera sp. XPORK-15E]|uniref:hypothetical protein n=1 Tax=Crocosphaera sp. XPORK-15E TaxID=3110247 RepID=UPI002B1EEAD9|nr:hypothetical protein [Crocosphaera sp. XPORK-15E]MEA5536183.1 hypothetical protein [Crocosphaera sp. XPORK-15E]
MSIVHCQLLKETYQFSPGLKSKFAKTRDYLSYEQQELAFSALRDYFLVCHKVVGG